MRLLEDVEFQVVNTHRGMFINQVATPREATLQLRVAGPNTTGAMRLLYNASSFRPTDALAMQLEVDAQSSLRAYFAALQEKIIDAVFEAATFPGKTKEELAQMYCGPFRKEALHVKLPMRLEELDLYRVNNWDAEQIEAYQVLGIKTRDIVQEHVHKDSHVIVSIAAPTKVWFMGERFGVSLLAKRILSYNDVAFSTEVDDVEF